VVFSVVCVIVNSSSGDSGMVGWQNGTCVTKYDSTFQDVNNVYYFCRKSNPHNDLEAPSGLTPPSTEAQAAQNQHPDLTIQIPFGQLQTQNTQTDSAEQPLNGGILLRRRLFAVRRERARNRMPGLPVCCYI
jgi:hypothetical protein